MKNRLLIVEDDPEIVSALQRGLAMHGYTATAEPHTDRALKQLTSGSFDGAIVDVMLGSQSGITLVKDARAAGVTLPILMLSALSDVENRTEGLDAGADDYIVKPFAFEELIARLKVQERLALSRTPAVLNRETKTLQSASSSVALTERECALLAYLITHSTVPASRGVLFDTLWARDGSASENVVDVYIGYLRKKISDENLGFEIKTIRNKGFTLLGTIPQLR